MDALDDPIAWVAARPAGSALQQQLLQGLARRAAAQSGALREALVARLVQRADAASPAAPPAAPRAAKASALSPLVAALQAGAGPELRNVRAHQGTWAALRMDRQLAQVRAPVPDHLGPLNSQVLMARALQQVQGLSPAYLQRLLAQLEGLAALPPPAEGDAKARPAARKAVGRKR